MKLIIKLYVIKIKGKREGYARCGFKGSVVKNITTKHSHRFAQIITELSGREAELASVYIISVRFNKDKMGLQKASD